MRNKISQQKLKPRPRSVLVRNVGCFLGRKIASPHQSRFLVLHRQRIRLLETSILYRNQKQKEWEALS